MTLTDVTSDVQQRLEPARERVGEQLDAGRARVGDAVEHARQVAAPRLDQARQAARPAAARMKDAASEGAGIVAGVVPTLLERVVAVLRALFGDLEERGRELASHVEPPRRVTRRNRMRTIGWFAGGFALGAGAGWYAHQRFSDHGIEGAQDPESHARDVAGEGSPYGDEAANIDARRETAQLN